mgnify:CR=1 FL=1
MSRAVPESQRQQHAFAVLDGVLDEHEEAGGFKFLDETEIILTALMWEGA